jgi:hypothetical protein
MYAIITQKGVTKSIMTGDYKTLSSLRMNAVSTYFYKHAADKDFELIVEYFSSIESVDPFKIEHYNSNGIIS